MINTAFLGDIGLRQVTLFPKGGFHTLGLALGKGQQSLEILVLSHNSEPPLPILRTLWKERNGGRAAPLLVVVLYGEKAAICGPAGEDPPAYRDLDAGQVERICREALDQPDRHAALRSLRDSMPAVQSEMAGVRNEGFLATHELLAGVRQRTDWATAKDKSKRLLDKRGEDLLRGLGFSLRQHDRLTTILQAVDRKIAIGVLLTQNETPELQGGRFESISPVSYGMAVADRENLPYVIIQQGPKIRLYPTKVGVGVGRRGRSETYVECHAGLLRDVDAAYLWLLFSAEALLSGGSLDQILDASGRFAGDLAGKLRDRIYSSVVPTLAEGIVAARGLRKPGAKELADTYEMTMVLLFRLLFIAYAEDKDLLPYRWNGLYQRRSLKTKAQELVEISRASGIFDTGDSLWGEITRLFDSIERGNREWGVPPYNGGLFASDPGTSPVGALLAGISLPNTILGPALTDLLLVNTPEGLGPVDFRSLGVREFGTIYEGLLESDLSIAETDLAVDREDVYRPARAGDQVVVNKGAVYLHNASGARKSTGTYFTKSFAVEHLLERSLEPALIAHIARLEALDDETAGERFFDFRVADISMGSGHFLVAAVDRIERAFTGYLSRRALPKVVTEFTSLRQAAHESLGSLADQMEIEDTQLLRRLIARRCIYGVDLNPVSVQLAKLAVWIHTFVPGLPLSLLDHNLVCGNSLVGIGQLSEITQAVHRQSSPLFPIDAESLLGQATEPLKRLGRIVDATIADIKRARKAHDEAIVAVGPAQALCDILAASRIRGEELPIDMDQWDVIKDNLFGFIEHEKARKELGILHPLHFPVAFPEVFMRDRGGFDVIVGNPPWEEATLEEHAFWARYLPGLRGLPQRQQEEEKSRLRKERPDLVSLYESELQQADMMRKALVAGPYPGMGTGDPDLYKAFCWRFWELASSKGGYIGVVLPRSALAAAGSAQFRQTLFSAARSVNITMMLNNKQWFFEDVHPQYTIGLVAIERAEENGPAQVSLAGPYSSLDRYIQGLNKEVSVFDGDQVTSWNDTASLPLLPSDDSAEVFAQLRKTPRLELNDGKSWRARPYRELDATNDKELMDVESKTCPKGYWPVYKGESFDLWNPDAGKYYAWANPKEVIPVLHQKRLRGAKIKNSPFTEFPPDWLRDPKTLPCYEARIAFRDVTNRTNRRTVIVSLIPPNVFITNKGPYLLWPRGDAIDQAYLLGVLSSIPLDWYARRFVEINLNFFIFNPLPVPRLPKTSPLHKRVVVLAGRLACPDKRFARWAEEVGVDYGPLPETELDDMLNELDGVVAHLYGLKEKQLVHIFETFHEGWDYQGRLDATLKHFRTWKKKI